jgi:NADH:ubiquinone oxidoreductase subunit 5 (subunit L)/multisubunit Na+/H+ antiporter MnhA subunit
MNRIGDFGFLVAMFLLFANLGTLDIVSVSGRAAELGEGGAVVPRSDCSSSWAAPGRARRSALHVAA